MATFATALGAHLEAKPRPKLLERRLLKILNAPPSKRRTAILKALETRARDKLGVGASQAIDWSAIDWAKVLDFILKLLVMLLPLFLGTDPDAETERAPVRSRNKVRRL